LKTNSDRFGIPVYFCVGEKRYLPTYTKVEKYTSILVCIFLVYWYTFVYFREP